MAPSGRGPSASVSAGPAAVKVSARPSLLWRLFIFILLLPLSLLRWSKRDPRRAIFSIFAEIVLRHVVLPPLIERISAKTYSSMLASVPLSAFGDLLNKVEFVVAILAALTLIMNILSYNKTKANQRKVYQRYLNDATQGVMARVAFNPDDMTKPPTLQEMEDVFRNLALNLTLAYKPAQILAGVPTFSLEIISSAHLSTPKPRLYVWAPTGLVPDPLETLSKAFNSGLKSGTVTLQRLAEDHGGDVKKATRQQIRDVLGLVSPDINDKEASETHVVMQRLTANPAAAAIGFPLDLPWGDKAAGPDYLKQLFAQMSVSPTIKNADTVGVQFILRRVDNSYWNWMTGSRLEKLPKTAKEFGGTQKELTDAQNALKRLEAGLNFQLVVQVFATFRGKDPSPAKDAVAAIIRHFENPTLYHHQPVAKFEESAALPIFTRLDPVAIVASFEKFTQAERSKKTQKSLDSVKVHDIKGPGGKRTNIALHALKVFEISTGRMIDRLRLKLLSGRLGPHLSKTAKYYKEDPLANFHIPGHRRTLEEMFKDVVVADPATLAPVSDKGQMELPTGDMLLGDAPPENLVTTPEPMGLTKAEEKDLSEEAKLIYHSVLARAYPLQLKRFLGTPGDKALRPGIGVISAEELPLFFALPRDISASMTYKVVPASENNITRGTKYDPERKHITFGESVDSSGHPVYYRVSKANLRKHMRIMAPPGRGKSELARAILYQYARDGNGFLLIEPSGRLISQVIGDIYNDIPERVKDIVYWDLNDSDRPIGLNILECPIDRDQWSEATDEIIDVFRTVAQVGEGDGGAAGKYLTLYMSSIVRALWTQGTGSIQSLSALYLFLFNDEYRAGIISGTNDSIAKQNLEELTTSSETNMDNKLDTARQRVQRVMGDDRLRRLLAQPKTNFDPAEIMAQNKMLIIRLHSDADMLFTRLVLSKFNAAMRGRPTDSSASDFPIMIDEFQKYASRAKAVKDFIAEGRKYNIPLFILHQFESQASAGADTQILQDALRMSDTYWTFKVTDAKAATDFANRTAGKLNKHDVMLLPPHQVGYVLQGGELAAIKALDTNELSKDVLLGGETSGSLFTASSGTDIADMERGMAEESNPTKEVSGG